MRPYNLATVPLLHSHGRHCYHDVAVAYGQTREGPIGTGTVWNNTARKQAMIAC